MSSTTTGLYTQCPLSFRIFAFIFTCLHKQNVSVVCCCCCCCCWVSSASAAAAVILLLVFERSSSALPPLPPPRPREEEEEEEEERKFLAARRIVLFCCCVRSFFEERFSSIFPSLSFSLSTKKNGRMSKRSFKAGTTLSSSSLIIAAFSSAASASASVHLHPYQICRRWYSLSEESKEEEELKEIGYYTGKKRNPLTDTRLHQYDQRPPPNALCEICSRRFCSCEENRTKKRKPEMPGPEDCCQSSPQCKFCVWTIYDEQLAEYETNKELYMDKLK